MAFRKRAREEKDHIFDYRVFVATPAYDGRVYTDYAVALAETCLVGPVHGVFVQASVMGNGAFIDVARNHFVRMFMQSDCTHLFFIDADLKWDPQIFLGLVKSGKRICSAVYPKRQDPEEYPVGFQSNEKGEFIFQGSWLMANRVPGGFLCVRRDVIERMIEAGRTLMVGNDPDAPMLFYEKFEQIDAKRSRMIGEDYAFCDDYVALYGEGIPVFPDADFTHGGRWKGNLHNWLNKRAEEEDRKTEVSTAA